MQLTTAVVSHNFKLELMFVNSHANRDIIEYNTSEALAFIEPFNWTSKIVDVGDVTILQMLVYHSANIPLSIVDWELEGAEVIEDVNPPNITLKVGQQMFMSFVLAKSYREVLTLSLTYKYSQSAAANRLYITSEIDELIMEQIFKSTMKIQAFEFKVEHSRVGKIGVPYMVKVTVGNVKTGFRCLIGLRSVPDWKVAEPASVEVEPGENEFLIQIISLTRTSDRIPAPFIRIGDEEYEPECDRELCFIESE